MFEEKDVAFVKGLIKIMDDATFPLKKREVQSFAMIVGWVKELELKIEKSLDKPSKKTDKKKV